MSIIKLIVTGKVEMFVTAQFHVNVEAHEYKSGFSNLILKKIVIEPLASV